MGRREVVEEAQQHAIDVWSQLQECDQRNREGCGLLSRQVLRDVGLHQGAAQAQQLRAEGAGEGQRVEGVRQQSRQHRQRLIQG